jgi:hypothetical protein
MSHAYSTYEETECFVNKAMATFVTALTISVSDPGHLRRIRIRIIGSIHGIKDPDLNLDLDPAPDPALDFR